MKEFHTDSFDREVLQSDIPVLVDFWAPWCSHCRALEPVLAEFAKSAAEIQVGKVNVDEEPDLAKKYGIRSIPTVLFIRDGLVAGKKTGVQDENELEELTGR